MLRCAVEMVELTEYLRRPEGPDMSMEEFVGTCLALAGIWRAWRESDGVARVMRYVAGEGALVVCGGIYQISDQVVRYFWLDIRGLHWRLGLDPHSGSERRAIADLESSDDLAGLDWDVQLQGDAEIRDDKLVPVSAWAISSWRG